MYLINIRPGIRLEPSGAEYIYFILHRRIKSPGGEVPL